MCPEEVEKQDPLLLLLLLSLINRLILGYESSDMLEVLTVPSIDKLIERISVRDEVSAHTRRNYGIIKVKIC